MSKAIIFIQLWIKTNNCLEYRSIIGSKKRKNYSPTDFRNHYHILCIISCTNSGQSSTFSFVLELVGSIHCIVVSYTIYLYIIICVYLSFCWHPSQLYGPHHNFKSWKNKKEKELHCGENN